MHTRRTECTDSSVSEEINDGDAAPTYNDNILCGHVWVKAKSCLEADGWPWTQVEEFERLTSLVQKKNEWQARSARRPPALI